MCGTRFFWFRSRSSPGSSFFLSVPVALRISILFSWLRSSSGSFFPNGPGIGPGPGDFVSGPEPGPGGFFNYNDLRTDEFGLISSDYKRHPTTIGATVISKISYNRINEKDD